MPALSQKSFQLVYFEHVLISIHTLTTAMAFSVKNQSFHRITDFLEYSELLLACKFILLIPLLVCK